MRWSLHPFSLHASVVVRGRWASEKLVVVARSFFFFLICFVFFFFLCVCRVALLDLFCLFFAWKYRRFLLRGAVILSVFVLGSAKLSRVCVDAISPGRVCCVRAVLTHRIGGVWSSDSMWLVFLMIREHSRLIFHVATSTPGLLISPILAVPLLYLSYNRITFS